MGATNSFMTVHGQSAEVGTVSGALRVLLTDLIDYAGLFPPAALDMKTAVENYARYRGDEYAWMLGRFVLPAARLGEFEKQMPSGEDQPWRLSVLVGPKLDDDMAALKAFAPRCEKLAVIDCIETKVTHADEVGPAHERTASATMTYYEVPFADDLPDMIDAIKTVGGRAKIRTGGLVKDALPSPDLITEFLIECADVGVAFKATAGLHHPIRCVKPLTYAENSPSGVMHGFLNVFLTAASVYAWNQGLITATNIAPHARRILEMMTAPRFTDDAVEEPVQLPKSLLEEVRREFAISFGSCSFEEPIADLRALNLL
jgi:hypothetical protein